MTTLTIDIPDQQTEEVISKLKTLGVEIRESKLDILDKLTKEDYQKHFERRAKSNKNRILKHL